jgi:hypothetical protein
MALSSKIELLDKLSKGESSVSVANHVNESTVRSIKKSEEKIRHSVSESAPIAAKICSVTRDVRIEKMEEALNVWIEDQMWKQILLSSLIILKRQKKNCINTSANLVKAVVAQLFSPAKAGSKILTNVLTSTM